MRNIIHFAVDPQRSRIGLCGKGVDDHLGFCNFRFGRREAAIDNRNLIGMDGDPASEAIASRIAAIAFQPLRIAEISIERVLQFYLQTRLYYNSHVALFHS